MIFTRLLFLKKGCTFDLGHSSRGKVNLDLVARVISVPGLGGLKETKNISSPSTCESQYCGEPP